MNGAQMKDVQVNDVKTNGGKMQKIQNHQEPEDEETYHCGENNYNYLSFSLLSLFYISSFSFSFSLALVLSLFLLSLLFSPPNAMERTGQPTRLNVI